MVRMMNTEDDFIGPVNLGNPNEFSILELAEKVIRLTNSKSKLIFKPLPHDDPKQRQPDITLAKEKVGLGTDYRAGRGFTVYNRVFLRNIVPN